MLLTRAHLEGKIETIGPMAYRRLLEQEPGVGRRSLMIGGYECAPILLREEGRKYQMPTAAKSTSARKRVSFSLHAPDAQSVSLAGDFNGWDPTDKPMKRDASGQWKATLTLPAGEYQYRFVVDGDWADDPQCDRRSPNEFGTLNCVRVVS